MYKSRFLRFFCLIFPFTARRLLIELRGNLGEHEPMAGEDFLPLVEKAE